MALKKCWSDGALFMCMRWMEFELMKQRLFLWKFINWNIWISYLKSLVFLIPNYSREMCLNILDKNINYMANEEIDKKKKISKNSECTELVLTVHV